jgi:hypothetical protein
MSEIIAEVAAYLGSLEGVRAAEPLEVTGKLAALAAEERYERASALPIDNLGIRSALGRLCSVVILKDSRFRRPPSATLYLVEDGSAPSGEELRIGKRAYRIVGEEIVADSEAPPPGAVAISDTFYIHPERRSDASRPTRFLLPPVPFPELLREPWCGRVTAVVSASPSPLADVALRASCGFPDDPLLATLVVGFDPAEA